MTEINYTKLDRSQVALAGLVVIVLTTRPKTQDDDEGFLRAIKSVARLPSEGSKYVGPLS
jgi:hypothetical protein